MSSHICHAFKCEKEIPPPRLHMCLKHWRMVPAHLKKEIWRTYKVGQEIDKLVSKEYLLATGKTVCAVAHKEGVI